MGIGVTLHAHCMIISKEIVLDMVCSDVRVFRTPMDVFCHGTNVSTPWDGNTDVGFTNLDSPVRIGGYNSVSPSRTGSQDIIDTLGSIGPQWSREAQPLDTSINRIYFKHRDPAPTCSEVIGCNFADESSSDDNSCCWMNLTRDAVLTKVPNFVNLGLSSVHTLDELGSVFSPTTRIKMPMDVFNWLPPGNCIVEVIAYRVNRTWFEQDYISRTDFLNTRENQDFGRQNSSMSGPSLDSTPLGTNATNVTMLPIDLIPVGTKTP